MARPITVVALDNMSPEVDLIRWAKQFVSKDKDFIDVGAHVGTWSLALAPFSERVFSFEPTRRSFHHLCAGVAMNNFDNVYPYPFAVGSKFGVVSLQKVSPDGGGNKIIEHQKNEVPINMITLDSQPINPSLIKIDVEGYELEVFKGAIQILVANRPHIIYEVNPESQAMNDCIIELLRPLDYKCMPIVGVANMWLASP
jgi:FkbM family methyltransferase